MAKNVVEKNVIYVGEGDAYERNFDDGKSIVLKKGWVTPVTDEMFLILKDNRHVYEVKGIVNDVQGKSFKEKILRE